MANTILDLAFTKMLAYLSPLIFILSALTVSDYLIELIRGAFIQSAYGNKRRRSN